LGLRARDLPRVHKRRGRAVAHCLRVVQRMTLLYMSRPRRVPEFKGELTLFHGERTSIKRAIEWLT
jgi:hypothetical protein